MPKHGQNMGEYHEKFLMVPYLELWKKEPNVNGITWVKVRLI